MLDKEQRIKKLEEQIKKLEEQVEFLMQKRITQVDVLPKAIKQRAIEAYIIFSGLAADVPDGTTEVKAYWATDTKTLYIYDGTVMRTQIFT